MQKIKENRTVPLNILIKENRTVPLNILIRTMNIDEPLARIKADGTVRYYQQDALGSIIGLSTVNGELSTVYAYDPFGNTTITGEASDNPFQYTGRENGGTGLYYYRARYYSPDLQRFISEDPIGLEGEDVNFYAYNWNDPLNYIDPYGTAAISQNAPPKPPPPPPGKPGQPVPPRPPMKPPKPPGMGCGAMFRVCMAYCTGPCPGGPAVKGVCIAGCVLIWNACVFGGGA